MEMVEKIEYSVWKILVRERVGCQLHSLVWLDCRLATDIHVSSQSYSTSSTSQLLLSTTSRVIEPLFGLLVWCLKILRTIGQNVQTVQYIVQNIYI